MFWGLAMFAMQVKIFHHICPNKWNWIGFGVKKAHLNLLFYAICLDLETFYSENKNNVLKLHGLTLVMLYGVLCAATRPLKCVTPLTVERLVYVHLKSVDTKYGVANYGFKIAFPIKIFWNNKWGSVWYNKIAQVCSCQICICNGTLTF